MSPLLFILAIEVHACRIRDENEIKGILIDEEEIKLTLFADDMTCFLRDAASYHRLLAQLQLSSKFSNLRVNNDRTEIFAIERHRTKHPHTLRKPIRSWELCFIIIHHQG